MVTEHPSDENLETYLVSVGNLASNLVKVLHGVSSHNSTSVPHLLRLSGSENDDDICGSELQHSEYSTF